MEMAKYVAFKSPNGHCVGATTEESYKDNPGIFDDEDISEVVLYEGPILDVNLPEDEYDKLFNYVMYDV